MTAVARTLHYLSILLTIIIGLSWVMFAVDEVSSASKETTEEINSSGSNTTPAFPGQAQPQQQPVEKADDRSAVRKQIDKASDRLTSPFDGIVAEDSNIWAVKTVPALLGLLLYGAGLAVLSRWILTRDKVG